MNEYLLSQQPLEAVIDTVIVSDIQSRLNGQTNQAASLDKGIADLFVALTTLLNGGKPDKLVIPPDTDAFTQLQKQIQSTIVASSVVQQGDTDSIREDVLANIDRVLHCLAALRLQLQLDPTKLTDYANIAQRYNARHTVNLYLNDTVQHLLNTDVDRWDQRDQPNATRWIPLQTVLSKSVTELIRFVIRSVPPNDQVDENFTSLLYEFIKGVHLEWNPPVPPEQLLWQRNNERALDDLARSQEFRDRVGADFAPYLEKLLKGPVETYEPEFQAAYDSILKEVQRYYLTSNPSLDMTAQSAAMPTNPMQIVTPLIIPATQPQSSIQQIPITTQPQPTTTQPVITPLPQTPISTPVAPPADTAAPTVDFRRPTAPSPASESAPTPQPAPPPAADPSKVKPLNLP